MNQERDPRNTPGAPGELAEHDLRDLLEGAGPRPEIPAGEMAAIQGRARAEWRRSLDGGGSPGRGPRLTLAIAATLLAAVGVAWIWRAARPAATAPAVATVEIVHGPATAEGTSEAGAVEAGDRLNPGTALATAPATDASRGVALRWADGQSVRLDAGTRVRLVDRRALELVVGAVYVDSGGAEEKIVVRTPLGEVWEIGTRFEVRLAGEGESRGLEVRVREGAIELRQEDRQDSVVSGEELVLAADGSLARGRVEPWADAWSWVEALAPPLDVEGVRLNVFLSWAARETGWELRYEDEALAAAAAEIELHGSIEGLSPAEAVDAFLDGSGLGHRLEEGVLSISR